MALHGHRPRLCPECTAPLTANLLCTACDHQYSITEFEDIAEDQAKSVKRLHEQDLLKLDGVQGVGIGKSHGQPVIMVYFSELTPAERLTIPGNIEGIRVALEESGEFQAQ